MKSDRSDAVSDAESAKLAKHYADYRQRLVNLKMATEAIEGMTPRDLRAVSELVVEHKNATVDMLRVISRKADRRADEKEREA